MKNVTVDKQELLDILKKNREAHRAIFEDALEGYRNKWIEILEERLEEARRGVQLNHGIWLNEPVDQTKDYDRAIRMVKMHIEDTIELDEKSFANFVLDDWSWSDQFVTTNSMYTSVN